MYNKETANTQDIQNNIQRQHKWWLPEIQGQTGPIVTGYTKQLNQTEVATSKQLKKVEEPTRTLSDESHV